MKTIHGFTRIRDHHISEIGSRAEIYRHVQTGAELLSLVNDDENKVFGITFRTPPRDSTGVAHILEHSVLCGSRKYPVKEPFVEILKGSLQTFLNAFTYPDKTCYPVASQNIKDFYNLVDVYLDAVFHPRIAPHIFQQEGWHYELEREIDPLSYKGVVYSEMKGSYSSPDRLLGELSQQSLFPDTTYGLDSGGDPKHIPNLTYEQFREFHAKFYHPSNARIFFYGDDNPEERLRFINEYLREFQKLEIDSTIPVQTPFEAPRTLARPFSAGKDEASRSKAMITVNWLLGETSDAVMNMALNILNYILLGTPGSPLRKALIDSGLGEDITGAGLENELRQLYFSVGLKGIDPEKAGKVEALILDTLATLSREGIDPGAVEAALNTMEFTLRENNTGSYPRGLIVMLRALTTWLYDGDPLLLLEFEKPLEVVKSNIASHPSSFEEIIDGSFLRNPHRTTVLLTPDPGLEEQEEETEREKLTAVKSSFSEAELKDISDNTRTLKNIQGTPDSPEALATIPSLKLIDLERKNKPIPLAEMRQENATVLFHDLVTNGIAYIDIGFDLSTIPSSLFPYIPLFGRVLFEMGTEKEDFVKLAQRIDQKTGGIYPSLMTSSVRESADPQARLFLRGKAMVSRVPEMLDILKDILFLLKLDNRNRFRQMVLEEKARQEQSVVPGGHQIVNTRLRSHFSKAGWMSEQMNGLSYLVFLRNLARLVDTDWPSVRDMLHRLWTLLVNRQGLILNVTIDKGGWQELQRHLFDFIGMIPEKPADRAIWTPAPIDEFEGMTVPAQINYVGKGTNLYHLGYRFHGSVSVITRYLRNTWLWDRVRVQGGAYGAFCSFDRLSGVLTFLSYRDPNTTTTLAAFDSTADYLRSLDLSHEELTKGIIGAIGDIDSYMLPDAKGYTSMIRHLIGSTEEERQKIRDEVLSTTPADFKAFGEILDGVARTGLVKILGSDSALKKAVEETQLPFKIISIL